MFMFAESLVPFVIWCSSTYLRFFVCTQRALVIVDPNHCRYEAYIHIYNVHKEISGDISRTYEKTVGDNDHPQ